MRLTTSIIMALTYLLCLSCQKERGYTGFVDPSDSPMENMVISIDKAVYAPGETITFSLKNYAASTMHVRYRHLGEILATSPLNGSKWTWQAPEKDFTGYLVEVFAGSGDEEQVLATIGVDVSSDWSKFPRYGFLSTYQKMSESATDNVIRKLNRLHINGVQFQDWHYKHHFPLALDEDGKPMETYLDIASRTSHLSTVRKYIADCHKYGMKAIFYNLCFGALDDSATDGVKEQWHLYLDKQAEEKDVHELGEPFKSSIYIVNPANPHWQNFIGDRNDEIYSALDFDGYQIDQLGDRGTLYDYDGNQVYLAATYSSFINAMKLRHPEKELIMNSVSGYGASEIVSTGNVTFAYNEVWENGFADLKRIIEDNDRYSDGAVRTVFAAYMNYDVGSGYFNTPGVLLADAVMFALGGSHLEMGEHMLTTEYFPNNNMAMDKELESAIVVYYDFMTAYQNILRDGGSFNEISVSAPDKSVSIKSWEPATGQIVTICKRQEARQIIHLLNFTDADSVSWKDSCGTMPEPDMIEPFEIEAEVDGPVNKVWIASPDRNLGVPSSLAFTQDGNNIRTTIPALKYWNMIVIEYN
ncbi:MAG: cycloisomaltooligosaccharide glucanotransferase [Bacteroidales bacterium]|nr:cycloisomaltooligosaccharide glucanotransferase [Bacteroidales bacterium]